jgi:carboxylate-amine ligase
MRKLPFKKSSVGSIGIELEFQLVDPQSYTLISRAKDLIRNIKTGPYQVRIKPEITQSMIEVNSSIHHSSQTMLEELAELHAYLSAQAANLNIAICGGGTHPFHTWAMQKIFPTQRYKKVARKYRYLSKMSTVFGQHIHVGCGNAEDALYLTHALARYVPQFIALMASSPFYQGVYTSFCSSRSTVFNAFPLSGFIPYLINWNEFSEYFYKMRHLGIITSMKDFYWDIRPKPEFGTVEIRVCDTPLTIKKAILITAYIQSLSLYLLEERPSQVGHDLYFLYNQNRFEASRYGFEGNFINPYTMKHGLIIDDIIETVKKIEPYTCQLNNTGYISDLLDDALNGVNDAMVLKQIFKQVHTLPKVVAEQCNAWSKAFN